MTGGARALATVLLVLTGGCALAGEPLATVPDRTERLAAGCNGCHGPGGQGSGAMPALAGLPEARIRARLEAWRTAPAADGADHVMVRFARALTPDDVPALARHYGISDPPGTRRGAP